MEDQLKLLQGIFEQPCNLQLDLEDLRLDEVVVVKQFKCNLVVSRNPWNLTDYEVENREISTDVFAARICTGDGLLKLPLE